MSRAGDGFQRLARGPWGARWERWEVVGWAIRDADGLYLTSLRRMSDRSPRRTILLRVGWSGEDARRLRRYGLRLVRVVRRVRDVGTEPLRGSECWGYEPGTGLCYRSQGWERALGCAGLAEPSGAGACSLGSRDWIHGWGGRWLPECAGAEALGWMRREVW